MISQTNNNFFETEYLRAVKTPSDINEHLPILYDLAVRCDSIVEFGVRTGVSSRAFLLANVNLLSVDIEKNNDVNALFNKAIKANYLIADTREITIEETDMLFIDSLHTYDQLKKELDLHGNKVKKYLVFHDTFTYGLKGEIAGTVGLLPAIIEFIIENPCWFFKIYKINNNGLIVLERKPSLK